MAVSSEEATVKQGRLFEKAIELVKKATDADLEQKYEKALPLYEHALEYFLHALKYEAHSETSKSIIRMKCKQYLQRADRLKAAITKRRVAANLTPSMSKQGQFTASELYTDKKLKSQLKEAIVAEKPNVHWDDVAGLTEAKEALKGTVAMLARSSNLDTGSKKPLRSILLYGPPGTGRSYLAQAVATEADSTFFSVSSSDLISKRPGESERLVKYLFELARASKPAIIFIDDVNLLCSSQSHLATELIKTEFLTEMQKSGEENDGILVLGATNVPWLVDAVTWKCFEEQINIPLPEESARRHMFEIHMGNTPHLLLSNDFDQLAKRTNGYSGADIGIVVRDALMMPIRKVQTATHFKQVSGPSPTDASVTVNDLWTPCGPREAGSMEMSWMSIAGDKLKEPHLTIADFLYVLKNNRPTVSADDLKKFEDFKRDLEKKA